VGAEEDLALVRRCLLEEGQEGPGAWEELLARVRPPLAGALRRVLARCGLPSGSQEVEEVLQDLFVRLLGEDRAVLRRYQGRASLEGYLKVIALRLVLARKRDARPLPGMIPSAEGMDPAQAAEARETLGILRTEVAGLQARDRLALALQVEGASLREVGRSLGLSEDAAAQLLSRARGKLRERLKARGIPDP
jgi:RNA polymerase sigma-70 factor (ECF subfamily)